MRWLPSWSACRNSIQLQYFLSRFRWFEQLQPFKSSCFASGGYILYDFIAYTSASLSNGMMLVSESSGTLLLSPRFNLPFSLMSIFIFTVSFWLSAFSFSLFNRLFFSWAVFFLYFIWSISFPPSVPFSYFLFKAVFIFKFRVLLPFHLLSLAKLFDSLAFFLVYQDEMRQLHGDSS